MFKSLRFKGMLLVVLFLQAFNLLLVIGNVISNPNYKVSIWQYLFALTTSTTSLALLAISLISRKELIILLFNGKEETSEKPEKAS